MCHCERNLPKTFRSGCEVTKESEFISGQSPAVDNLVTIGYIRCYGECFAAIVG